MAMKATPKHSSIAIKLGCARCLFRSATPFKLEIVQITSERVSHLGSSAFAPVGRGTADHPDRDRQRDKHTADRRPDRQTRLHGQPRNCIASMFVGRVRQCFPQHPIEHIHTPTPSWTGSYTTPPSWKPANTTCANTRPSGSRPQKKNRNGTGSVQRQARRCRPTITPVPFRNNTRYSNLQIISHCLVNQPAMPRFDGIAYFWDSKRPVNKKVLAKSICILFHFHRIIY